MSSASVRQRSALRLCHFISLPLSFHFSPVTISFKGTLIQKKETCYPYKCMISFCVFISTEGVKGKIHGHKSIPKIGSFEEPLSTPGKSTWRDICPSIVLQLLPEDFFLIYMIGKIKNVSIAILVYIFSSTSKFISGIYIQFACTKWCQLNATCTWFTEIPNFSKRGLQKGNFQRNYLYDCQSEKVNKRFKR